MALSYEPTSKELNMYLSLYRSAFNRSMNENIDGDKVFRFLRSSHLPQEDLEIIKSMVKIGENNNRFTFDQFIVAVRLVQFYQNNQAVTNLNLTVPNDLYLSPPFFEGFNILYKDETRKIASSITHISSRQLKNYDSCKSSSQQKILDGSCSNKRQTKYISNNLETKNKKSISEPMLLRNNVKGTLGSQCTSKESFQTCRIQKDLTSGFDPVLPHHVDYSISKDEFQEYESYFYEYDKKSKYVEARKMKRLVDREIMTKYLSHFFDTPLKEETVLQVCRLVRPEWQNSHLRKSEFFLVVHLLKCFHEKGFPIPQTLPLCLETLKYNLIENQNEYICLSNKSTKICGHCDFMFKRLSIIEKETLHLKDLMKKTSEDIDFLSKELSTLRQTSCRENFYRSSPNSDQLKDAVNQAIMKERNAKKEGDASSDEKINHCPPFWHLKSMKDEITSTSSEVSDLTSTRKSAVKIKPQRWNDSNYLSDRISAKKCARESDSECHCSNSSSSNINEDEVYHFLSRRFGLSEEHSNENFTNCAHEETSEVLKFGKTTKTFSQKMVKGVESFSKKLSTLRQTSCPENFYQSSPNSHQLKDAVNQAIMRERNAKKKGYDKKVIHRPPIWHSKRMIESTKNGMTSNSSETSRLSDMTSTSKSAVKMLSQRCNDSNGFSERIRAKQCAHQSDTRSNCSTSSSSNINEDEVYHFLSTRFGLLEGHSNENVKKYEKEKTGGVFKLRYIRKKLSSTLLYALKFGLQCKSHSVLSLHRHDDRTCEKCVRKKSTKARIPSAPSSLMQQSQKIHD